MNQVIVIVDDEKMILDSIKYDLQRIFKKEYDFEFCESAEEAILLIDWLKEKNREIPVVITDYIMPYMKGDRFLEIIYEKYPEILSILLTGLATINGVSNAINNANLYQFITKPWTSLQLEQAIKRAINYFNAKKEIKIQHEELLEANRKLSQLDESKSNFLYLMSHELYTPLSEIILSNDLILKSTKATETVEYCGIIKKSAYKLKRIGDLALFITRLKVNKYSMYFKSIEISKIIDLSIFKYKSQIEEKNIKYFYNNENSVSSLNMDFDLIKFVIDSVIENSIKYSEEEGKIFIKLTENLNEIVVSILDEGCGFNEDILKDPFTFFASSDIIHHTDGIGLSLAASKVIMDAHGFRIDIENSEIKGALVKLILPKTKKAD